MDIGDRLKKWREFVDLSQTEFAKSIGMKQGSYSDIERGRAKGVSASTLKLIAITYKKLSTDWLLTGKGSMLKEDEEDVNMFFEEMKKKVEEIEELKKRNLELEYTIELQKKIIDDKEK